MKAILQTGAGGADTMYFGDAERPRASAGEIVIEVAATSVNRPDVMQREGHYPPPADDSEILGLEVAGTVADVADDVTRWRIGERVMALIGGGGYAQYARARADHAMAIPDGMDDHHAACVCETYLTAYLNLFLIARLGCDQSIGDSLGAPADQAVLLHGGGGGVNTAAIQLCKHLAPDVMRIVTASSAKVERVAQLGADVVIDYRNESFAERVREVTDKRGADVILDHLGASYLKPNLQCLRVGGTLLLIGVLGGASAEFNLARVMVKRQRIIGSVLRSRAPAEKAAIIKAFADAVLPLMARGAITPLVSEVYPLARAADAHRAMEASQHFGKIVLAV